MKTEYNSERIRQTPLDFWAATGIDMDLLTPALTPVCPDLLHGCSYCRLVQGTPAGKRACHCSDRELIEKCRDTGTVQTHICHAGLVDAAIPLLHDGYCIGYIIFGRMRSNRDFSAWEAVIRTLGVSREAAEEAYQQIPFYDADRIRSVSNIATLVVKYILLENMFRMELTDPAVRAAAFIRGNLQRTLSIQEIARGTGISKTVLYKAFQNHFGCTPGAYLNSQRVERSLQLLQDKSLSLEEISQQVGFSSASYYSKIFRAKMGMPPLQYRKNRQ